MYPSPMVLLLVKDQTRKLPTLKEILARRRGLPKSTLKIYLMKSSVLQKRSPRRVKRARGKRPRRTRTRVVMMCWSQVSQSTFCSLVNSYADRAHDQHKLHPLQKNLRKNLKRRPLPLKMLRTQARGCYPKRRRRS